MLLYHQHSGEEIDNDKSDIWLLIQLLKELAFLQDDVQWKHSCYVSKITACYSEIKKRNIVFTRAKIFILMRGENLMLRSEAKQKGYFKANKQVSDKACSGLLQLCYQGNRVLSLYLFTTDFL